MNILLVSLNAKYIHSSLALRSIAKYCKVYEEHLSILEMTINHEENDILKEIYEQSPDVIAFSCYIWNMSIIEQLLPTLRKILPHTTLILGGPEVSYESEYLFEKYPIDLVMEGEGEETWRSYLSYIIDKKGSIEEVKGIVYRSEGKVIRNVSQPLLEMGQLPFVYDDLEGLEHKIIYYEASRGCPFNCQYCLSSIEKKVRFLPLERVKQELQFFLDQKVPQVKFVDRTFNADKKYAKEIWRYIIEKDNGVTNFHFEIAAELLDEQSYHILKDARKGLIQFEIGVQSTNLEVLEVIDRKMPFEEIKEVSLKIKALDNIHQHLDLIAGLPLENYASFRKSFNEVLAVRPEQFQLGFLKLLRGSGLRKNAEKYGVVYKEEPPYEILYTNHLSYGELLRLHAIEELVERYYNSERFHTSLEYFYTLFDSTFDFYEAFADFWKEKGYDQVNHQKKAYYLYLEQFITEKTKAPKGLVKELIRFDWYQHEFIKEVPKSLQTVGQEQGKKAYTWIKKSQEIEKLCPHSKEMESRQRIRKFHVEYFSYCMEELLQKNWAVVDTIEEKEQTLYPVLFDYTQKETKVYFVALEKMNEINEKGE